VAKLSSYLFFVNFVLTFKYQGLSYEGYFINKDNNFNSLLFEWGAVKKVAKQIQT
jgi:hypothetical protein